MILRDLLISLGYDLDKGSEKQVQSSIQGVKDLAENLLGTIGVTFSLAGIQELVSSAADLKAVEAQFNQTFRDIGTGASYVDEATEKLSNLSDTVGISESRMKSSFTSIAAFAKTSGMDVEDAMDFAEEAMTLAADSSAYFDRSMEDTTAILKSLLKGNFQMDDNLGFQATQFTRDAKAMELFNKSYNDLTEAEKQKTILKLMADANKQMGAFGQAARESGEYTNQMAELNAKFKEFKAVLGNIFLEPFLKGLQLARFGMNLLIKTIATLTGKSSYLSRLSEGYHAIIKRLAPSIEILGRRFSRFSSIATTGLSKVAILFGGMDNLIKLISLVATAFFAVWSWNYVISGAKAFIAVLKPLFGILGGFSATSLAIVAAIVAIGLVIEDFVNFLAGNNSLIGVLFDSMGIGADNARNAVFKAFDDITEFIETAISEVINCLDSMGHKIEEFCKALLALWNVFKEVFAPILFKAFKEMFLGIIDVVLGACKIIGGIIEAFAGLLTGNTEMMANGIVLIWEGFVQALIGIFSYGIALIVGAFNVFVTTVSTLFSSLWDIIINLASNGCTLVYNTIVSGFTSVMDWLSTLPEQAFQWGSDFINGLVNGVLNALPSLQEAVSNVAESIRAQLHFSVPDTGPLTDYESWMPDMVHGLTKTLKGSASELYSAVDSMAGGIKKGFGANLNGLINASTAYPTTAMGAISSAVTNVTQNVNITNSFYGENREMQHDAAKAMKNVAGDTTALMARAFAYAR